MRFAPSPTGSLHVGSALQAVANRDFADRHGGALLLRIDDTDVRRTEAGSEEAILDDLAWVGVAHDEGPVRQSDRSDRHREAAERLLASGRASTDDRAIRFQFQRRPTLVREDGRPTYHLATVVDDLELGVTHVIRGQDLQSSTALHVALAEALDARPPEYLHLGLIVGTDGRKLSKRHGSSTLADLREAGIPAEAVRRYLDELGIPRHDVHYDLSRIRRLAIEVINELPHDELAARAGAPPELAPALRGARDLEEARRIATLVLEPHATRLPAEARPTLERFAELRERADGRLAEQDARSLIRELKAIGGDLRALRVALTGRDRGPELWTVLAGLSRDETLRRVRGAIEQH